LFCLKIKEQLAILGRAKLETSRLEQLANIEANRKEALAKLDIKYATADKAKTTFGYIGIISLSLLWSLIILNDLAKVFQLCYKIVGDELNERLVKKEKERKEERAKEIEQIILEMDEASTQDLEKRLSQIHLQLIKACARRRACEK